MAALLQSQQPAIVDSLRGGRRILRRVPLIDLTVADPRARLGASGLAFGETAG